MKTKKKSKTQKVMETEVNRALAQVKFLQNLYREMVESKKKESK
jgi:hypothetical protein